MRNWNPDEVRRRNPRRHRVTAGI